MRVAREGLPFILPPLVLALLLLALGLPVAAGAALLVGLFLLYFFRDPERVAAADPAAVLAPADGRVVRLVAREDGATELSIFLSPLDVHVNRVPVDGILREVEYRAGRYRPAFADGASHENEQLRLRIDGERASLEMRLITGVLVRRIVLWKRQGEALRRGERLAIMKFGSRVDLVLPSSICVRARRGDRVRAGVTAIGEVRA